MNSTGTDQPEFDHVIDCTPGKMVRINLKCGSGRLVQTAMFCETYGDGNGQIHILESDPCFDVNQKLVDGILLCGYLIMGIVLLVLLGFVLLYDSHRSRLRQEAREAEMNAEAQYGWDLRFSPHVEEETTDEKEREEDEAEAEAAAHWVAVGKRTNFTPSFSESDAGSSTGSSGSESWWSPSRCGMELGRGIDER